VIEKEASRHVNSRWHSFVFVFVLFCFSSNVSSGRSIQDQDKSIVSIPGRRGEEGGRSLDLQHIHKKH